MLLLRILAFSALCIASCYGYSRRTCSSTGFCRRYRDWLNFAVEKRTVYHIPPRPLCGGSTGTFNASVKHSALGEKGPDVLQLQLRFYEDGTVRFTMDEEHKLVGDVRTRYTVPSGDVIQDKDMQLAEDVTYSYDLKTKTSKFRVGKSLVAVLRHEDVVLTVSKDGQVLQTVNGQAHLMVEGTRVKYNDKCPYGLPSCNDTLYIDPACSPGDHYGSWAEEYQGKTDYKPYGPSIIALDVTFSQAKTLYGLQERGTISSKLDIGGFNDAELYRFFNLDTPAYPVQGTDAHGAIYGAIPTLTAIQDGQCSVTTTSSLLWMNPSDTLVSLNRGRHYLLCTQLRSSVASFSESGVIDLLLFPGQRPQEFSTSYHRATGLASLPPLFGLGFHRSRYAVESQKDVENLVTKYTSEGFPVDVFWLDIEHTDAKKYFTWNYTLFPDPMKMSQMVRAEGKEMVTIVDPHIKVDNNYPVYSSGNCKNVFVKERIHKGSGSTDKNFEGSCWPGLSVWPDFTNDSVRDWWAKLFSPDNLNDNFYTWNDMNEPSVFDIPEKTMPRDLVHSEKTEHRDVHNIYGHYFRRASFEGQRVHRFPGKRPFVLTRSFFVGSHRFGPMWTGDSVSQWDNLQAVLPMISALAATGGYSFTGSDIGGFIGSPDAELYTRWFQLSAATNAFFRLHSDIKSPQRDPWLFDSDTLSRVKNATVERYHLLPYWYHAFARYSYFGEPIIRPLWYAYLDDPTTYECTFADCDKAIDQQVLVGSDIMVRGVTDQGVKSVKVYFPRCSRWYKPSGELMPTGWKDVDVTMDDIPRYFRAGSIIAKKTTTRNSSSLMMNDSYSLYVYLDPKTKSAEGHVYLDDTISYNSTHEDEHNFWKIKYSSGSIAVSPDGGSGPYNFCFAEVVIFGIDHSVSLRSLRITSYGVEETFGPKWVAADKESEAPKATIKLPAMVCTLPGESQTVKVF
ncbi:hypothetical protein FOL47_008637 [Perkinsus chesapeaki]|uniref:Neutral alpha-glucosidase AB n=1 Tax=Perkinsus chesapeaki TaxID=330153 RepID=A0A7J6LCP5_PERCH|nr:hypothetical protein FOL47_008637 [Perkinsus chesapeaki]